MSVTQEATLTADTLDPAEADQLVSLRLMLEQAQAAAKASNRLERVTATVLLDAVVERVTHLVAVTRSLTVRPTTKLEDLVAQVRESLGDSWRPNVLPTIRQLHRARNSAQHEALPPDAESVPSWAAATTSYVSSLVQAQWQRDIQRVVVTDAIEDPELRLPLEKATAHLAEGDYHASITAAVDSLSIAHQKWLDLHRRARSALSKPFHTDVIDRKSFEYLERRVDAISGEVRALTFSSDGAEWLWLQETKNLPADALDRDAAVRAIAFCYWWIVRFETAARDWVPDREMRAVRARRHVRTGAASPSVGAIIDVRNDYDDAELTVVVQLRDVPPEEDYDYWAARVRRHLSQEWSARSGFVDKDGTATLWSITEDTAEERIACLASALEEADRDLENHRRSEQARIAEMDEKRAAFANLQNLPEWAGTPQADLFDVHESKFEVEIPIRPVTSAGWHAHLPGAVRKVMFDGRRAAPSVLFAGESSLRLMAADPSEISELLAEVVSAVESTARDLAARAEDKRARIERVRTAIGRAISD